MLLGIALDGDFHTAFARCRIRQRVSMISILPRAMSRAYGGTDFLLGKISPILYPSVQCSII